MTSCMWRARRSTTAAQTARCCSAWPACSGSVITREIRKGRRRRKRERLEWLVTAVPFSSSYRVSDYDRQWQFQCGAGSVLANVSTTCTLLVGQNWFTDGSLSFNQLPFSSSFPPSPQPPINTATSDVEFVCPNEGYLGGMASTYVYASFDREWQPYCCERPFSSLIDCNRPTSGWENDFRDPLNFTAPPGHVISGVTSFFFNRLVLWQPSPLPPSFPLSLLSILISLPSMYCIIIPL